MTEQLYVISRMETALTQPLVPKSELKRRLDAAWGAASKFAPSDTWDWDKAIDILLNGEKEHEVAHLTKCTCERCTGIAVESLYEE